MSKRRTVSKGFFEGNQREMLTFIKKFITLIFFLKDNEKLSKLGVSNLI